MQHLKSIFMRVTEGALYMINKDIGNCIKKMPGTPNQYEI